MKEDFEALTELSNRRKTIRFERNMQVIVDQCEFDYEKRNNNTVLLFRNENYPVVNFYPSTGKWYLPHTSDLIVGDATAFLNWYRKQKIDES